MQFDAYHLAMLPIAYLSGRDEPFDRYRNSTMVLDDAYRDVVNAGVWAYQLHTYLGLVRIRFGQEIQRVVLEYQLIILDREAGAGAATRKTLELIDTALATRTMKVPTRQGAIEVPVEMSVALLLLLDICESPHYVADPVMRDVQVGRIEPDADWNFATYLSRAREDVVTTFSPMLENVDLNNNSVNGLKYPD
jgi:hypothetical protein